MWNTRETSLKCNIIIALVTNTITFVFIFTQIFFHSFSKPAKTNTYS